MRTRIAITVLLVALVAAACGSGGSVSGVASLGDAATATTTADGGDAAAGLSSEEAMLALAECLRGQGLQVADPEMGEDGQPRPGQLFRPDTEGAFDREEFRAAMDACSEFTDAITTQFDRADRADMEDQMVQYAACMRENGYDMPDPDFSIDREHGEGPAEGEGFGGGPFAGIDPTDPAFQAANAVCQDLFGGGFGPRFGGDGPPPGGAPPGA